MLNVFKTGGFRRWGSIAIIVIVTLPLVGQIFLSSKANGTAMQTEGKVVSVVAAETVAASGSLGAQRS